MFKMPRTVAQRIIKLQRKFFWGADANGVMASPTVKWSSIELPKVHGGLGVGNILHKNLLLLFKWWWRFSYCDHSLWKRIVTSIHNIKGLKASSQTFQGVKRGMWAHLLSDDNDTSKIRNIVEQGMQYRIGEGNSILFWHDNWCPGGILKTVFPRLFLISTQKDYRINQMGEWQGDAWVWKLAWRRRLYDWEMIDEDRLKARMAHISPRPQARDEICWQGVQVSTFPIKDIGDKFYACVTPLLPKEISMLIWKMKVPPRVQLIFWLANLEKLKTGDMLIDHGRIDPSLGKCPFCEVEFESNSHLLFTCSFSWRIWMEVLKWWGVQGVLHSRCAPFSIAWRSLAPKRSKGKLWIMILGCVIWSLWFERNNIKFKNGVRDFEKLILTIKVRVIHWAKEMLGLDIRYMHSSMNNLIDVQ